MTVTVIERWPHWCAACQVPLHLSRSITAGLCCCCRGDHAPDTRVDVVPVDVTDVALPPAPSAVRSA